MTETSDLLSECERIDGFLAAAADDLDPADREQLVRHLATCADCRALADDLAPIEPVPAVFPTADPNAFELGPVIGHGGMGRIRVARDRRLGRQVAIKELLFNTDALAARFVREARIAASLQHPNIVPVYEVGSWADGTPFYTMPVIAGRTLFNAFVTASTLEERMQLLPSLIAATDAVAFAHAKAVVHRDLTPANILLGDFGETLVIDWGLAKDLRIDVERVAPQFQTGMTQQVLTVKGDVLGSPAYMPYEQATGEVTDERADVYALGAILYHLLAGRAPYVGKSAKSVLASVRRSAPTPVEQLAKRAPRALVSIVEKAMARDAADRYANAKELASELRRFQAGLLVDAHRYSARERLARWFTGGNTLALGTAAVALTGILACLV